MTESSYPMIGVEDAWRQIAGSVSPLNPQPRHITEALGLVLAEDVFASEDMPPFPSSAMDGYAVIAGDAAPELRVIGEQLAGRVEGIRVVPGAAMRIMTGASLPDGADAVIPVECAVEERGVMRALTQVSAGEYVRPRGQDIARGDAVLSAGTELGPAEIGLLATIGHARPSVHPAPIVAIMATGDELVSPDETPGPGQIRNSNSYALMAAVQQAGCQPLHLGAVEDTEEALRAAMLQGLAQADVLLTSGGVSMGVRDLVKPLLEELGRVHFGRVSIKPGKPLTLATVQGKPVFGLPGFPVSSLVCFEMFVRPALRLMAGQTAIRRPEMAVRLSHRVRHDPDRTEFQRATIAYRDGSPWAATTGVQVSGRLKSMVGADALLRLPAGCGDFQEGDIVTAVLIRQPEVA